MLDNIGIVKARKLLDDYGLARREIHNENKESWKREADGLIVYIPTQGRIDVEHLKAIAIDQIGMHLHEWEFWINENG